ncbi:tRNA endonuclease ANKZF1-like [Corticium candelabrum]|uniref:tRNA endonuclease ANKZF1-like n=1 Tax=Corticium candelabrum TaxID=121492 RepID=UPI002E344771|nr:tRNA endonuclease ANKZF1-like [Corticium candelabrum]
MAHSGSLNLFSKEAREFLRNAVIDSQMVEEQNITSDDDDDDRVETRLVLGERMACSACHTEFVDRPQQVQHFKLDWHRYNIKRKIIGAVAVTEEDFEDLSDVSSISGSDTESRDTSELDSSVQSPDRRLSSRLPKMYFTGADKLLYSLYKCVVSSRKTDESYSLVQISSVVDNPVWVIVMLSGGHFAGAVFNGSTVVAHKTFHRYTVRAKSGTAQSVRDAQGNQPKSAGASLRRYNEAALQQDIHTLLESWATHLQQASAIFLRAPGENRKVFFSGKNSLLSKDDHRVSSIPFATRRPTLKEVERIHNVLSTIQCHGTPDNFTQTQERQSIIRADKRKHFAEKKALSEKNTAKLERGPEDVGAATVYPREALLQSQEYNISITDPSNTTTTTDGHTSAEKIHKKKKAKKTTANVDDLQQDIESTTSMIEKTIQVLSLEDTIIAACKRGDLGAVKKLVLVDLYHNDFRQESNVVHHQCEELQQAGQCVAVESDCDVIKSCDKERRLNFVANEDGETILHAAARGGHPALIVWLLSEGTDPAMKDKKGRPPYAVARDKPARNAFRRFMADYPYRYDYSTAQVPSALTDDLEKQQEKKKADKKKAQKKSKKQKDKEEKEVARKKQTEEEQQRKWDALSDREKRALVAEKRLAQQIEMKAARGKTSGECNWCHYGLDGLTPFSRFDYKYCSLDCLKSHREELQRN